MSPISETFPESVFQQISGVSETFPESTFQLHLLRRSETAALETHSDLESGPQYRSGCRFGLSGAVDALLAVKQPYDAFHGIFDHIEERTAAVPICPRIAERGDFGSRAPAPAPVPAFAGASFPRAASQQRDSAPGAYIAAPDGSIFGRGNGACMVDC